MHLFSLDLAGGRPPIHVLVAQFSAEQSLESLFNAIYADPESSRRRASAIVLRPSVAEHFTPEELEAATRRNVSGPHPFLESVSDAFEAGSKAFARFEDIPVLVLHSDNFALRLSSNINLGAILPPLVEAHAADPATLDAIRTAEFDHLVARSKALLVPVEGAHYDPPSHRPMRAFLRVGNIQYSRQAVDAIAFWLLPHVAEARGLLIDTWSISSIAYNLSRVLTLYDGRPPVPVEMLSRYQDRSPEAQASLLEVLDRLWAECDTGGGELIPITCLVSATQSGSLVDVLTYEIDSAALPIDIQFVALFQLGPTAALPSLNDRSGRPEFAPLPASSVREGSAIRIDPQVYFPLAYRDMEYVLRKKNASDFRQFVDRYGTSGLFTAHRDQASDGRPRHHAVHLDMSALCSSPAFDAAFEADILAISPPPKIVLTPAHEVARALGQRAVAIIEATGASTSHLQHPSLLLREEGLTQAAEVDIRARLTALDDSDSLLVLDDCFITGDRLTGYQTRLRQLGVRARLDYRVGVARPEDLAHWAECSAMLRYRDPADKRVHQENTVSAVETLCLPNWQERDCPWCREAVLYERLLEQGIVLPDHLQARRRRLADGDGGLVDDLFLVAPGTAPLQLYGGSIFVPPVTPQATVFAAIASAVQRLRTLPGDGRPTLGPRRYPVATVLRAREYLQDVYKDSILRAAVLRAANAEELNYMNEQRERRRTNMVAALLTSSRSDEADVALELVLAHAHRKCRIDLDVDTVGLEPIAADLLASVRALSGWSGGDA